MGKGPIPDSSPQSAGSSQAWTATHFYMAEGQVTEEGPELEDGKKNKRQC